MSKQGMRLYPGTGAARGGSVEGWQPTAKGVTPAEVQRPSGTAIAPPVCPDCERYRAALDSLKQLRVPIAAAEAILRATRDLVPLTEIEVARICAFTKANHLAEEAKAFPDLAVAVRAYEAAMLALGAAEEGKTA